ncbi:MAG: hypothetical protein K0Q76_823 [Panacagrimonas sp.]|jgi:uncharacterized membrane protein|nr:DUF502 domain-containing protein [Panacagrimonas sp.]MCC2655715.1 hypothetical protein [Panacagrimonas sp.]
MNPPFKKPLLKMLNWRRLTRTFLTGLFVLLPIMVTLAIVMWLIGIAETVLGGFIRVLLPGNLYLPGMGLVVSLVLIFLVGIAMQAIFFRELINWLEDQLERIPLIKTVYSAVKDLTGFFSRAGSGAKRFGQVVQVQLPGMPIRMLGFVTLEDLQSVGLAGDEGDTSVAVYLPMSYQIGGYTVLLPRSYLTPVDMGMEEAMRFLITAGLSRTTEPDSRPTPAPPASPAA